MKRILVCMLVCLGLLPAGALWAQEKATPLEPQANVFSLGEVVVQSRDDAVSQIATVDTVDWQDIELNNAWNVSDALNTLPGVSVSVGTKNERNINVRGFNQRYVPVFLDGIPQYVPYDGYVDTGKLPTGGVSKIILSKGASSVLYGPNTMGGVINIITRKPTSKLEGDAFMTYGQDNLSNMNLNLGSSQGDFYGWLNAQYLDTDGYRMSSDFKPTSKENGRVRNNSDINQKSGNLKLGWTPALGHEYAIGVNKVESEWGLPPYAYDDASSRYWRFTDWEKDTYYLIGDSQLTENLESKVRLYYDTYYNVLDSYDDDTYTTQTKRYAFHSTYDDNTAGGSLTLRSRFIPSNYLSFALHYKEDTHKEQDDRGADWEKYEATTWSLGLEDDIRLGDTASLVLGVSYDQQEADYANGNPLRDDDSHFNPQAGIFWNAWENLDLHASWAQKSRFPTLFELYSSQFGRILPNPELESETADNYEIGAEMPIAPETLAGLTFFYSDIQDLIVRKRVTSTEDQYQNIGKARFQGLEFAVSSGWIPQNELTLNYTYLDAEDRSPDRTSDHLEETPEHKIFLSDLWQMHDRFGLWGKLEYNSERWYEDLDTGEWKTLDGFWTVDLKGIVTLTQNFSLEAGVKNLFDENYEFSYGFPREGRTLFATLRGRF